MVSNARNGRKKDPLLGINTVLNIVATSNTIKKFARVFETTMSLRLEAYFTYL